MKPLYAPQSLLEQVIPKLSLSAQAVFYACLQKSGVGYHPYPISNSEIQKLSGLKTIESVRKGKRALEKNGIARFLEKYVTNGDGTRRRDRDIFVPLFDLYEAIDKRDSKGLDQDTERNRQAVNAAKREAAEEATAAAVAAVKPDIDKINRRIDKHDFDFSRLHADLQQWREFLEYSGKYGKTTYFTAKPGAVSPAFVESEFKRHGLAVVVKAG
jgi:hypothetical protein